MFYSKYGISRMFVGVMVLLTGLAHAQISIDGTTITFSDLTTLDTAPTGGGTEFVRTIVVSPTPGDATASGTTLRNAYDGVSGATSMNPYVVLVEPGLYDLGSTRLDLQAYVHLRGTSRDSTIIRSSHTADITFGCIDADSLAYVELSNFTLEATGTSNASGLGAFSSTVRVENVHVTHTGAVSGTVYSVYLTHSSSVLTMKNCKLTIPAYSTGSTLVGLQVQSGEAALEGCEILINESGGSSTATRTLGVDNRDGGTTRLRNCRVSALDTSATNSHALLAFTGTTYAGNCELAGTTANTGNTNITLVNCWDANFTAIADM